MSQLINVRSDANVLQVPTITGIRIARHQLQAENHGPLLDKDLFAAYLNDEDYENLVKEVAGMNKQRGVDADIVVHSAAGASIHRGAEISFMVARDGAVKPITRYKEPENGN